MNRELQQYRFAWIEGSNITRARLEAQFKDGITDPERLEKAIEQELTETTKCASWRRSEIEQMGCRDGARMAALEFFWTHRQDLRCDNLAIAQNG
jgi:hypothetical protein